MTAINPEATPKTRTRRILDVLRLVAGLVGAFLASVWIGLTDNALPTVSVVDQRIYEADQPAIWKLVMLTVFVLSIAIVTGAWTAGRVDVGQAICAAWAGFWLIATGGLLFSAQFSRPEATCTYLGCWPYPYQELAIFAPAAIGLITMLVLASVGRPTRAWIRAAIPVLIVCILSAAQQLAWQSTILPVLLGPPPT